MSHIVKVKLSNDIFWCDDFPCNLNRQCHAKTESTIPQINQPGINLYLFILLLSACNDTQIEGIPTEAQTHCRYLSDCSGLECCFENQFSLGSRRIYFMTRMDCNHLEFQIENKKVQKSLTALTDSK